MLRCRRGEWLLSRPLLVVGAEEGREQRVGQRLGQLLVGERDVQLDGPTDSSTHDLHHSARPVTVELDGVHILVTIALN